MDNTFKIYIDRLKDGQVSQIKETTTPAFLEINESDLEFTDPVEVKGESYLADDHLIIHLEIETLASLPCSICNEKFKTKISIDDFYHAEPIKELKTPIFDFTHELREMILLQVPPFAECHEGKCPEREFISKFLIKSSDSENNTEGSEKPIVHFPFQGLDGN